MYNAMKILNKSVKLKQEQAERTFNLERRSCLESTFFISAACAYVIVLLNLLHVY